MAGLAPGAWVVKAFNSIVMTRFNEVRGSAFGRAILKGHTVHIPDVLADPEFDRPQLQSIGRFRAVLAVPLMREGIPIGVLGLVRSEPRPFTNEQITLVRNFAAQAVIAIENTRLLNELRHRTDDLSEALEQQTATSEVLRVISSSPGELKPVFDAMLENAVRICEAQFGNLFLFDGHEARMAAMHNAPAAYEQLRRGEPVIPLDGTIIGPSIKTKKVNHVRDLSSEEPYARSALVKKSRCTVRIGGANAARGHGSRWNYHLPAGSPAIHGQADRAGAELRRASRHRD